MTIFVSGDDITFSAQLKLDDVDFAIADTATVKARVIGTNHSTVFYDSVTCDKDAVGADWANSLIVVTFPSAATADVSHDGPAMVEIEVDDSGKTTFFGDVTLKVGTI